jgi:NADH-quinone oxidoreductase subunit L
MTSFYMFRLWFKTFFGPAHFDEQRDLHDRGAAVHLQAGTHAVMVADRDEGRAAHSHGVHESPWIMLLPLVILAILSVIGGWVGVPAAMGGHNEIESFLAPVFSSGAESAAIPAGGGLEIGLAIVSVLVALAGFYVAYVFYYKKPEMVAAIVDRHKAAYALLTNKYWVDEFYGNFLVLPLLMFTRGVLDLIFERGVVNGSARAAAMGTRGFAWFARKQISGNIRSYAGWLAIGAAAVLAVMIFGRSLWVHT